MAPVPPASKPTRDDEDVAIARKMFIAGCFLLPWLWIMCLFKYKLRVFDASAPPALRWYLRAQIIGIAVVTALFIGWEVFFQRSWRSWGSLGESFLIYVPDTQWWLS